MVRQFTAFSSASDCQLGAGNTLTLCDCTTSAHQAAVW